MNEWFGLGIALGFIAFPTVVMIIVLIDIGIDCVKKKVRQKRMNLTIGYQAYCPLCHDQRFTARRRSSLREMIREHQAEDHGV